MAPQLNPALIARQQLNVPPTDPTNADLAAAVKMLAMLIFHQMSAPVTKAGSTQFPNMHLNEVTGNGRPS